MVKFLLVVAALSFLAPALVLAPEVTFAMWKRMLAALYGLSSVPSAGTQTLSSLVHRWFGASIAATVLSTALSVGAVVLTLACWRRPAAGGSSDREVALLVTCAALLTPPAWVHYLVVVPFAQAVLLGASGGRPALLAAFGSSFMLGAASVIAVLIDPSLFFELQRSRTWTLSALVALIGLWCVPAEATREAVARGLGPALDIVRAPSRSGP